MESVGLDIHSLPGTIQVSNALRDDSASSVPVGCRTALDDGIGITYWFGDNGHIYQRSTTGVWTDVYTDAAGSIKGSAIFDGYIYWATANKLHRKPYPGLANWADVVHNWQTLDLFYSSGFHQMTVSGDYLLIANSNTIASVEKTTSTFTASGTPDVTLSPFPVGYLIYSLRNFGDDVVVGISYGINAHTGDWTKASLARWDLASPTWTSIKDVPDNGIQAAITIETGMIVFGGKQGNIYNYDGTNLTKIKRIKKSIGREDVAGYEDPFGGYDIYPDSVCIFNGMIYFGLSRSTIYNSSFNAGIYCLGKYDDKYPLALTMVNTVPTGVMDNVWVGAILSMGTQYICSYVSLTGITYTYKVAKSETVLKDSGYLIFSVQGDPETTKTFMEYLVGYKTLGSAATPLTLQYWKDFDFLEGSSPFTLTLNDYSSYHKKFVQNKIAARALQFKLTLNAPGISSYGPIIDTLYVKWNEEGKL